MELYTIKQAAEELNVSTVTARKWLGDPDDMERLPNGNTVFLYSPCKVCAAGKAIISAHAEKTPKGYRKCRSCPAICKPEELINGKCADCKAFDLCRKYCCPDLCCKHLDQRRVCKFAAAFERVCKKFQEKDSV